MQFFAEEEGVKAEHSIRNRSANVLQAIAGLYNHQELFLKRDGLNKNDLPKRPRHANRRKRGRSPTTRLLDGVDEVSFEQTTQETHNDTHTQVRHQRDTWRSHIVATFFLGDEGRMFRELWIGRDVFDEIVIPSLTSRSSAVAIGVSFAPTTNVFCFARLPRVWFARALRTLFTSELSIVAEAGFLLCRLLSAA